MKRDLFIVASAAIITFLSCCAWGQAVEALDSVNQEITVKKVSRTVPSVVGTRLFRMTLREKVASLLILHTPGTDAAGLKDYLDTYQPGGFIFMSDNIPADIGQLTALTGELQTDKSFPYLFAVDQEGGVVKRLPDDNYPAAADLKNLPVSETGNAFSDRSKLLSQAGLNLNFGIVADITGDSNSFIYQRVLGSYPTSAGERVAAAVTASKDLTLSTLKHFPGHGEAAADSHNSIPTTDVSFAQWQSNDKIPFKQGILAGADVVMFGHLRYSSVDDSPASLSVKWHDILKNELNFKGLTVTDDMGMLQNSGETQYDDPIANAVAAIKAGNTMLVYVLGADNTIAGISIDNLIDGIVAVVESGELSQIQINQNARQVLTVRHSLAD